MREISEKIIRQVANLENIDPAYLEKDWYLVYALSLMQKANTDKAQVVFSGGTSLSKGYGLISRFSEDIDFMIYGAENFTNRNNRSNFKHNLIDKINEDKIININPETLKSRDLNQFFKFYIDYPSFYNTPDAIRRGIKTEVSIKQTYLEPITQEITTFIGKYIEDAPTAVIPCVSPVETAANKFCGLMWRLDEDYKHFLETGESNNKNLMRHLHDLSALYSIIMDNSNTFLPLIETIYQIDVKRGNKERNIELEDFIEQTYNILKNNKTYHQNYDNFVEKMYYTQDNIISFETALSDFEKLCNFIIDQKQENRPTM